MTRAEKVAKAQELRERGLLLREIAVEMGVARTTVSEWLHDPDGSRVRARKDGYRGRCEECGAATDGSNGADKAPSRCAQCSLRATNAARRSGADVRERQVAALYRQGLPAWVIAERLGETVPTVASLAVRARRHGLDVPFAPSGGAAHRSKVAA